MRAKKFAFLYRYRTPGRTHTYWRTWMSFGFFVRPNILHSNHRNAVIADDIRGKLITVKRRNSVQHRRSNASSKILSSNYMHYIRCELGKIKRMVQHVQHVQRSGTNACLIRYHVEHTHRGQVASDHHVRLTTCSVRTSSALLASLSGRSCSVSRALSACARARTRVRSTPEERRTRSRACASQLRRF